MTIRTFTVTVSNPGSGNKYYIDGVLQDTINLAEGYTYVFNYPSAHPFKFSTTSDGTHNSGSEYTTGVTVNSSTQVQITVAASAPQLYYYCQYHSGMGGQANTVDSDTWGMLKWGQNSYGTQDTANVFPTGLSITSELGSAIAFPNRGWGAQTWGTSDWGEADVTTASLTGLSITSDIGSVTASADRGWGADAWSNGEWGELNDDTAILTGLSFSANVGTAIGSSEQGWGRAEWGNEPWGESNSPTVAITGLSITSELGTAIGGSEEGWGRDEWGIGNWGQNITLVALDGLSMSASLGPDGWGVNSFGNGQWGDPFTFDIASIIGITGQTLSADVGAIAPSFDMVFTISSPGAIGVGQGSLNVGDGSDFTQGLASFAIPAAVGSISPADVQGLTTQKITAVVNASGTSTGDLVAFTLEAQTMSAEVGSISPADIIGLTGLTTTANVGTISPTNMTVGLTGQAFSASLQTVGFGQIGYQDVDITGNTSYTDVNHAA